MTLLDIRVSNNPPIGYYIDNWVGKLYSDSQVDALEPSEFGISQEIREKANNAEEMRMSFYRVPLKDH